MATKRVNTALARQRLQLLEKHCRTCGQPFLVAKRLKGKEYCDECVKVKREARVELTFARLLSLARWARAAGRNEQECRGMLAWVIKASKAEY